jgi:gamma-glutamylcyclotransferase (GGCT)/AIG2-like uncharacterized protein YtfP
MRVFVYGTLKKGMSNHSLIEPYISKITPTGVRGWLVDLGAFPAMIPGQGLVLGEMIEFLQGNEKDAFQVMDLLEGVRYDGKGLYSRISTSCRTADGEDFDCQVYIMTESHLKNLGFRVDKLQDGIWPTQKEAVTCLYVAYRSCANRFSFSETVTKFDFLGRVTIPGYRVRFLRYSEKWSGGVADLVQESGHSAEGALYRIPINQLPSLDRREGAPNYYRRIPIVIDQEGVSICAFTYEVVDKLEEEQMPSKKYLETILSVLDIFTPNYLQKLREHVRYLELTRLESASVKKGR